MREKVQKALPVQIARLADTAADVVLKIPPDIVITSPRHRPLSLLLGMQQQPRNLDSPRGQNEFASADLLLVFVRIQNPDGINSATISRKADNRVVEQNLDVGILLQVFAKRAR